MIEKLFLFTMLKTIRTLRVSLLVGAITILLGCAQTSNAQYTSKKKSAINKYVEGVKYFRLLNYQSAIVSLNEAIAKDENFIEPNILLGSLYQEKKDYVNSKKYYDRSLEIDPNFRPDTYLRLAEVELKLAKYAEALSHLKLFKEAMNPIPKPLMPKWNSMVANCEFAAEAIKHPVPFEPENMGRAINTGEDEYHPSITVDGELFVFTAKEPKGRSNTGKPFYREDLYFSVNDKVKGWQVAKNFRNPVNTPQHNEGASSVSHDGKYLFFTACNLPDGLGSCDLYVTHRVGNRWAVPKNMGPQINSGDWDSHPSLSPDGQTLYFASNRKGGIGESDIWQAKRNPKGGWFKPRPVSFNTQGSDFTPYIHADGQTMFFSSDGYPGMGGHDVFVIRKEKGKWGLPKNVGYPINTEEDEYGMIADPQGRMAYYASERKGGVGKFDLYQFELYKEIQPITASYIKGKVVNANTKQPLSAEVQLIDRNTEELITSTTSDKINGSFLAGLPSNKNYVLNVAKKGYLFYSDHFELKEQSSTEPKQLYIPLVPIQSGASVVLKNVFFETSKFDLKAESKAELNKLVEFLKTNADVKIQIGGHTDNVGNANTNMTLSENRAKAVKTYLVEHGASADRIAAKGYGAMKPVADNATEEGRAQNRRTEFSIQ